MTLSAVPSGEHPPEGHLCERLRNYAVHESHSATRGVRGALCPRLATAKDSQGRWACSIHLGADKRGEKNRERREVRDRLLRNYPTP